jgi:hypothetical protein
MSRLVALICVPVLFVLAVPVRAWVNTPSAAGPAMQIDGPTNGAMVGSSFTLSGWAVDRGAASGTGVDAIHVYAYPVSNGVFGGPQFVGQATYGSTRSDVGAVFGARFASSGFSLSARVALGTYRIVAYAHSTVTGTFNSSSFVDLTVAGPLMSLDGPRNGTLVLQPFNTGGWAVDLGAAAGTGVDAIHVWAFPVANGVIGSGQFVDAALLGGARGDVGAAFGPQFANAGFNFLMKNLAPGQYYVGVYVRSNVSGAFNQQQFSLITIVTSGGPFGGGTFTVGKDFPAARYYTTTATGYCYWERANAAGEIIANNIDPNGSLQNIVDIAPSDFTFFSENGCGAWSTSTTAGRQSSISAGQWLVGPQVVPGTYRATPSETGCYWERRSDFTGSPKGIIANNYVTGFTPQTVTILPTDTGFVSDRCGDWIVVAPGADLGDRPESMAGARRAVWGGW